MTAWPGPEGHPPLVETSGVSTPCQQMTLVSECHAMCRSFSPRLQQQCHAIQCEALKSYTCPRCFIYCNIPALWLKPTTQAVHIERLVMSCHFPKFVAHLTGLPQGMGCSKWGPFAVHIFALTHVFYPLFGLWRISTLGDTAADVNHSSQ